jgi:hypothetical protein
MIFPGAGRGLGIGQIGDQENLHKPMKLSAAVGGPRRSAMLIIGRAKSGQEGQDSCDFCQPNRAGVTLSFGRGVAFASNLLPQGIPCENRVVLALIADPLGDIPPAAE